MSTRSLRLLYATSECAPWVKTGGLGDVAAGLPAALAQLGVDLRLLLPAYRPVLEVAVPAREVAHFGRAGNLPESTLFESAMPSGVCALVVHCPALFDRPGGPYQAPDGRDWDDNAERFALLSLIAASLAGGASPLAWKPQVVHCNDWQTGLAPAYLRAQPAPKAASLITIHNLGFQGLFPGDRTGPLALPPGSFGIDGVEFFGQTSFLKAGLVYADAISTVSPTYAREIVRAPLGFGLEGLLATRQHALTGILNGIDTEVWTPATDMLLAARYDRDTLELKARNKAALQARFGLDPDPDIPLFAMVSRLAWQKGADMLVALAPTLVARPAQLAVLGSGDDDLERSLLDLAAAHAGRIAVSITFDETLAHGIEAGADFFLMPSRFEPCGLNQMYSQRYGTPPIAHATGGLVDSIVDATPQALAEGRATGFLFAEASPAAFLAAIERALALYAEPARLRGLQRAAMARDDSWPARAKEYIALYDKLAPARGRIS